MFQSAVYSTEPLANGDVGLVSFYARMVSTESETGMALVKMGFLQDHPPHEGVVGSSVAVGRAWRHVYVPFRVRFKEATGAAAGTLQFTFNQGLPSNQVVEVGGVRAVTFAADAGIRFDDLPRMDATYDGREPDAAWRKGAAERIERIRKGDLTVTVTDAAGQPVRGAGVRVAMRRHAFAFGTAVSEGWLFKIPGPDAERYRREIPRLFTRVVSESGFKWWEWREHREDALRTIRWARENGLGVRGHTLVWPSWRRSPFTAEQVEAFKRDPSKLREEVLAHVRDVAGATKGQIVEWDVLNEPTTNHDYMDLLGPSVVAEWFKEARRVDPAAKLFVNDNRVLASDGAAGALTFANHAAYERVIRDVVDNGGPLDGVGMQGHFWWTCTPPPKMLEILDDFGRYGEVAITEFDQSIEDERLQGDFFRDVLTVCFSHPRVTSFTMWGFWDGRHYHRNAPIYRQDWSLKPSGEQYMDLVFRQWWTDAEGETDAAGRYAVRGFLGDYDVRVTHAGTTLTRPARIDKGGSTVTVVVD
jgi:GH35 family endo-1,4-beta-xylanase